MYVQKCENCSNKFTKKTIRKSIFFNGYEPIVCEKCRSIHYVYFRTRILLSIFIPVPLFTILLITKNFSFNISFPVLILIFVLWYSLLIFSIPFFARYRIEEKNK
ncbi:TIGR04104 family putative zinc finger protein [Clostridium intestinale]|uniref:TIGR04104 family putative zinc finger protein n=1 Tax=Clostridium intestinale TaxID=36845 RepID=UPI003B226081